MRKSIAKSAFFLAFSQLGTLSIAPTPAQAGVSVGLQITIAPPALPVYVQPPIPGPDYIWTPGYWAFSPEWNDYYWVPGTWVIAPRVGYLWTPGYWSWDNGYYFWNAGYWGLAVGFYGGIDYGFGYPGRGYYGGRWRNRAFYYNRYCNNFGDIRIRRAYNQPFNDQRVYHRMSYNGGPGGAAERPRIGDRVMSQMEPTSPQLRHQRIASEDPGLRASMNQGRPPIVATREPGDFQRAKVIASASQRSDRQIENGPRSETPVRHMPAVDRQSEPQRPQMGPIQERPRTPQPGRMRPQMREPYDNVRLRRAPMGMDGPRRVQPPQRQWQQMRPQAPNRGQGHMR